jgi:hypothetical protein
MSRYRSLVARIAAASWLMSLAATGAVQAEHGLQELKMAYGDKCAIYSAASERLNRAKEFFPTLYNQKVQTGTTGYLTEAEMDQFIKNANVVDGLASLVPVLKEACDIARERYAGALTQAVLEATLAGAESDPAAVTPSSKTPPRTTRRPPQPPREPVHSVSSTQAEALIGGILLDAIGSRINREQIRRRDTGGGTTPGGGGTKCHHNPQTSQTHCGSR